MAKVINEYVNLAGDAVNVLVEQGTGLLAQRAEQYATIADEIVTTFRTNGEDQAADVAALLGGRVRALASYLRGRDGRKLWADCQEVLEGRGWVVAGAGLLTGFAISRAIRSSPPVGTYATS
jgi:hypothetical protein